jgi:hypothetical protein
LQRKKVKRDKNELSSHTILNDNKRFNPKREFALFFTKSGFNRVPGDTADKEVSYFQAIHRSDFDDVFHLKEHNCLS